MADNSCSIRAAQLEDAPKLVELMALLGHSTHIQGAQQRIASLAEAGVPQLVAVSKAQVVGLCGLHKMTTIHRTEPVGRITILVVNEDLRGNGIGRALLHAAEDHLRQSGCRLIEVTSNDRLVDAQRFYEHMGYERTSKRFAKSLI